MLGNGRRAIYLNWEWFTIRCHKYLRFDFRLFWRWALPFGLVRLICASRAIGAVATIGLCWSLWLRWWVLLGNTIYAAVNVLDIYYAALFSNDTEVVINFVIQYLQFTVYFVWQGAWPLKLQVCVYTRGTAEMEKIAIGKISFWPFLSTQKVSSFVSQYKKHPNRTLLSIFLRLQKSGPRHWTYENIWHHRVIETCLTKAGD